MTPPELIAKRKGPFGKVMASAMLAVALLMVACSSDEKASDEKAAPPAPGEVVVIEELASAAIRPGVERSLSRLVIIPRQAIVPAGERVVFTAIAYDQRGRALPQLELRWSMKDNLAGSISPTGLFRAATYSGIFRDAIGVSATYGVGGETVQLQTLASVSIIRPLSEHDIDRVLVLPGMVQVEPGASLQLTALALDRDRVPVPNVVYTWEVLDPMAGTIDEQGQFTATEEAGSYLGAIRVVGYKRQDRSQTAATAVSVEVSSLEGAQQPTKVNLLPQAVSLRPGDAIEFRAFVLDNRGNLFESIVANWNLRDTGAGALDSEGVFRAGSQPGTYLNLVEVTVTPLGVEPPVTLNATATVTVLQPAEETPHLLRAVISQQVLRLQPGESAQLAASAIDKSGQIIRPASIRWYVTQDVAEVTADGTVTALDMPGTYADAIIVEVEDQGGVRTASATLIIVGPLARVEIVPSAITVVPNQVVQFIYAAYDANDVRLFDASAKWEVLDPAVGKIDNVGLFIASGAPGEYPDVIKVTVSQRQRPRPEDG